LSKKAIKFLEKNSLHLDFPVSELWRLEKILNPNTLKLIIYSESSGRLLDMIEASLSKLDDKGVFTIVKVENIEKKVWKEIITEVNIETEEEFDGIKNFYTSRKMIVAKFYDNGKLTQLAQDIQKGKKYRVKIFTQKFGNGKEDYDIAKS